MLTSIFFPNPTKLKQIPWSTNILTKTLPNILPPKPPYGDRVIFSGLSPHPQRPLKEKIVPQNPKTSTPTAPHPWHPGLGGPAPPPGGVIQCGEYQPPATLHKTSGPLFGGPANHSPTTSPPGLLSGAKLSMKLTMHEPNVTFCFTYAVGWDKKSPYE